MKTQATKLSRLEQRSWDYWTSKGYQFKPGEKPPASIHTPPGLVTKHPVIDAFCGAFILVFVIFLLYLWLWTGAGLHV